MSVDWPRFEREARRVHERYMVEVVEAFGLCPWARDARVKGRVNLHVTFLATPDPIALAARVAVCMASEETEIGMLLCPLLALSPRAWRHLSAEIRAIEQQRNLKHRIAIADFHPIAAADLTTAERLVPFLRRSPDPMLQIVRIDVLDRVRRAQEQGTSYVDPALLSSLQLDKLATPAPSVTERVAQNNLHTIERAGDEVAAILEDIHADRNRAYAAVGNVAPTHAHISDTRDETLIANASNRDEKPESEAGYSSSRDESHKSAS